MKLNPEVFLLAAELVHVGAYCDIPDPDPDWRADFPVGDNYCCIALMSATGFLRLRSECEAYEQFFHARFKPGSAEADAPYFSGWSGFAYSARESRILALLLCYEMTLDAADEAKAAA